MADVTRRKLMAGLAASAAGMAATGAGCQETKVAKKLRAFKNEEFYDADGTFNQEAANLGDGVVVRQHGVAHGRAGNGFGQVAHAHDRDAPLSHHGRHRLARVRADQHRPARVGPVAKDTVPVRSGVAGHDQPGGVVLQADRAGGGCILRAGQRNARYLQQVRLLTP